MIPPLVLTLVLGQPHTEDPPPPLPPIESIIEGLARTEASIRSLSVTTDYVCLQQYGLPVDRPFRTILRTEFIADRDGKAWSECVGEKTVVDDSRQVKVSPFRWRGAFDGVIATAMEGDLVGPFQSGSIDTGPSWYGVAPFDYTTHWTGDRFVSKFLKERQPTTSARSEWDGRPAVLVETPPIVRGGEQHKAGFLIDTERRIVVRRTLLVRHLADGSWKESFCIESRDHKEIAPGIWLPMLVKHEQFFHSRAGPSVLGLSYEGRNSDWKVNVGIPSTTFRLEFPPEVRVTDRRPPSADARK